MMHVQHYIFVFLLLIASFVYSCDISPECDVIDDMEGFEALEGESDIVFYDSIPLPPHTVNTAVEPGDEYQLDDSLEVEGVVPMGHIDFPEIDHEAYTLIGKYLQEPCLAIFKRKWIKVDDYNYRYLIKVVEDRRCITASCLNYSYNLIAVPKLPENAKVKIEVGRKVTKCEC